MQRPGQSCTHGEFRRPHARLATQRRAMSADSYINRRKTENGRHGPEAFGARKAPFSRSYYQRRWRFYIAGSGAASAGSYERTSCPTRNRSQIARCSQAEQTFPAARKQMLKVSRHAACINARGVSATTGVCHRVYERSGAQSSLIARERTASRRFVLADEGAGLIHCGCLYVSVQAPVRTEHVSS